MARRSLSKVTDQEDEKWRQASVPETDDLVKVAAAARACRACNLYKRGIQTVFGKGSKRAKILLLGEQPGDHEDLTGKPFVGPAGKFLDRALVDAGIEPGDATSRIR